MSQTEVFKRLFCNGLPASTRMLERSKTLMSRDEFDADCVDFHNAFLEYGLDFAFCWCSARYARRSTDMARAKYTEIVSRTGIDHLYGVDDLCMPETPLIH